MISLAADFKHEPYWWERAPRPSIDVVALPAQADVVVVGSGYAGLLAAIELSRSGRNVLVLEAQSAGFGASSRSVGMIGGRLRLGHAALAKRFGDATALAMMHEARDAYAWFLKFVRDEAINCDLQQSGRLVCAWTPNDYQGQARLAKFLTSKIGIRADVVDKPSLSTEIDTRLYHGAMVLPDDGGVDPARYHAGLMQVAQRAGVQIIPGTRVNGVQEGTSGVVLETSRGTVRADNVVLATNGYTASPFSWFQRRIIAVGSQMAATAPLPSDLLDRLLPKGRLVNDTRQLAYAIRRSPDGTRLLVGGRALTLNGMNPRKVATRLGRILTQVFPELDDVSMTHAWDGPVAFTFDRVPHIGSQGRIHFMLGCNGSGIVMSSYLGMQVARLLTGKGKPSVFADREFPTAAFYTGSPWFMPPVTAALGMRDRFRRWSSSRQQSSAASGR
jgi:glycine/D-amino acid oxidase-like deaminating enzyme